MRTPKLITSIVAAALALPLPSAYASSHREAPFLTEQPKVDGTDFYMFRSYQAGREGFVTLVANYQPVQDPGGGPNYYSMDPDALYEIHIDNTGDAKEDLSFQFRFQNTNKNTQLDIGGKQVAIPLINAGPITASDTSKLNVEETYTVNVKRGNRRGGEGQGVTNATGGAATFVKPVDNIGNKSIPDYAAYAARHVYDVTIPGCTAGRMFVGQRKDPFVVNIGELSDLINLNPLGAVDGEEDNLARKNVTSMILEVPTACVTAGSNPIIGGWTTASLRQGRLLGRNGDGKEGGAWAQVSRLGMPLVNELVIGLKDKDRFNSSKPEADAQFADYVTNPTLPAIIELLYPTAPAPKVFPRTDLVAVFLTGVEGVNKTATPAEMLRLNTSIAPTASAGQNNLGAAQCFVEGALKLDNAGCDPAGFPNGRRPGDDVVDIALRVAMGYLLPATQAPAGRAALTDGATVNASFFDTSFPYIRTPLPGAPN